jgi:hypothetical protein
VDEAGHGLPRIRRARDIEEVVTRADLVAVASDGPLLERRDQIGPERLDAAGRPLWAPAPGATGSLPAGTQPASSRHIQRCRAILPGRHIRAAIQSGYVADLPRTTLLLDREGPPDKPSGTSYIDNMTRKRRTQEQDLERHAPDLLQIDTLYAAARRPAFSMVWLTSYASSTAVLELLDAALKVAQASRKPRSDDGRTRLRNALDAFEQVVDALQLYHVARNFQPRPSNEGRNALRRLADRPTRKSLETLLARNDLRPEYLAALWRAAVEAGRLRDNAGGVEVFTQANWRRTAVNDEDWLWKLAEDPSALEAMARWAEEQFRRCTLDPLLRFRQLRLSGDGTKFLELVGGPLTESGEPIPLLMARYAARELKLFGGELPADWAQQIARDPDLIRKVATCVCDHCRHARRSTGRVHDQALDEYRQALCASYERLAGRRITYGTQTNLAATPVQAQRTGAALEFLCAGLRLIDPASTVSQAQRHIDRRRGWRR